MKDTKYVVFKLEDGEFWAAIGGLMNLPPERIPHIFDAFTVKDAVVIRRQDHFAPAALHTYASSISIAVRVVKESGGDPEVAMRLESIADYFSEQAADAEAEAWKLPD